MGHSPDVLSRFRQVGSKSGVFKLCVEETISVALQPPGYGVHGHDLTVKACWCNPGERIDIEVLASILSDGLKSFRHRPLWEVLGRSDAMIEDLLLYLKDAIKPLPQADLCELEARWSDRAIILILRDDNR